MNLPEEIKEEIVYRNEDDPYHMWGSYLYKGNPITIGSKNMGDVSGVAIDREKILARDGKTNDDILCFIQYQPVTLEFKDEFHHSILPCPFRRAVQKDIDQYHMITYIYDNIHRLRVIRFPGKESMTAMKISHPDLTEDEIISECYKYKTGIQDNIIDWDKYIEIIDDHYDNVYYLGPLGFRLNTTEIVELDGKNVPIDKELAPLVKAMNDAGLKTSFSCAGHGEDAYISINTDNITEFGMSDRIGMKQLIIRWKMKEVTD